MNTFLHTKFKSNLYKYVNNKSALLIAISSGQDSLCLLKLLTECLNKNINKVEAIYIDHQWKKDSLDHTQHILNLIKAIKIPIAIYQIKELSLSEADARKIRYKILIQHAMKQKCNTIITGHHNNDKIETFIQNLIRGTSLSGITNLAINKKINQKISILRPLINFTRPEITWFCRRFCLPIWSDITNYNLYLKRNRIRYELVPYLQNYFNPNIQETLTHFITLCQQDNEYIKENTLKLYLKNKHKKLISLNLKQLCQQHNILKGRVIRLHFHYHFNKEINKQALHYILNLIHIKKRKIFFFNALIIQYYQGWLYVNINYIKKNNNIEQR